MKRFFAFVATMTLVAALGYAGGGREQPTAVQSDATSGQLTTNQAPALAAMVESGDLEPLAERLPDEPMVIQVVERIGEYGGEWRSALLGGLDHIWMIRIVGYEHLVRFDPEWTGVIPNVAKSFSTSSDSTEFTFELREGMRWSDGDDFNADDIMFWYEAVLMNDDLEPPVPAWLTAGGEPVIVQKIDDYTVKFVFAAPNGQFIRNLATIRGGGPTGYPEHYLREFHPDYNPNVADLVAENNMSDWVELFQARGGVEPSYWTNPSFWRSSGIPTLHAWAITQEYGGSSNRAVLERNPYYWKTDPEGNQLPYIDRLIFDGVEDNETLLLQVLNGDIDMMARHFNTVSNRPLIFENQEQGDYRLFGMESSDANLMAIMFNLTHEDPVKREIFSDIDFRVALSHAINRKEIIDAVYLGRAEPRQVAPQEGTAFYDEEFAKQYTEFDPDLAKTILDEAGYDRKDSAGFRLGPDGNRISVIIEAADVLGRNWPDVLELIRGMWQDVGIQTEFRLLDRSLLISRKRNNQHDVTIWASGEGREPMLSSGSYLPIDQVESGFAMQWAKWYADPSTGEEPPAVVREQMRLFDQANETADQEEQVRLMKRVLEISRDQFYVIGLSSFPQRYGIARNNFRNVPDVMPESWIYPNPAPTNTSQYFIINENDQ